jgi:hypothetical protein
LRHRTVRARVPPNNTEAVAGVPNPLCAANQGEFARTGSCEPLANR